MNACQKPINGKLVKRISSAKTKKPSFESTGKVIKACTIGSKDTTQLAFQNFKLAFLEVWPILGMPLVEFCKFFFKVGDMEGGFKSFWGQLEM